MREILIVIGVLVWVASTGGAFYFGMDYKEAKVAEIKLAVENTRKEAEMGAADAISKIVVRNTTIQGRLETVIRDNPVYRDCKHDDSGMRLINEALTGRAGPSGGGSVPGTDTTH